MCSLNDISVSNTLYMLLLSSVNSTVVMVMLSFVWGIPKHTPQLILVSETCGELRFREYRSTSIAKAPTFSYFTSNT